MKILVVEDEILTAAAIADTLVASGYEVTDCVDHCDAAVQSAMRNPPDLVFLDIALAGKEDGIETAERLRKNDAHLPVIFLTNLHDEKTLRRAQEANPADYLIKPFTPAQLPVSIQRALFNLSEGVTPDPRNTGGATEDILPVLEDTFFIKDSEGVYRKYHVSEILSMEADRAYCYIHTPNEKLIQSLNLKQFSGKMLHPNLVRVHRSWVVNIEKIEAIKGNVLVIGKNKIPVSPEHMTELMKRIRMVR